MRTWFQTVRARRSLGRVASGLALLVCLGGSAALAQSRLVMVPLQDRLGDPEIAAHIDEVLFSELSQRVQVADPTEVRRQMRTMRLRDGGLVDRQEAESLTRLLEADQLLSVAVLSLRREPVPQLTLAGFLVEAGREDLAWAGFVSVTGIDKPLWLGRGGTWEWERLVVDGVQELLSEVFDRGATRTEQSSRSEVNSFRSPLFEGVAGKLVAVIPLENADEDATAFAGESATRLLYSELYRRGARIVLPGIVARESRRPGVISAGGVSRELREAIGAELFVVGTVERWAFVSQGLQPQPEAGLSLRFVDGSSGQILASGHHFRNGFDRPGLFKTGRIYGDGVLGKILMGELLDSLAKSARE